MFGIMLIAEMIRRPTATKPKKKESVTQVVKSPDGPMSLALSHMDALFLRIQQNKVRTFDDSNIASLRSLDQPNIKLLNKAYGTTLENIKEAVAGDEFFIEAYQQFNTPQLKLLLLYLKAVKTLKHNEDSNKLRQKSVRKTKEKPASELVKKVLYLNRDPETKVEGIKPTAIIGAQQLWIYNTKTRKLGCYWAKNDSGLTVKGTTVLNYDEAKSTTKTLRKPKEQLWKFMTSGFKFWDAIRSVPQKIAPRTNRETLLLKIG